MLQVLDDVTSHPRNDDDGDEDDHDRKFNTFWPMVMMLITAIIFIIIIIIVCRRFCRNNGRPEWGRRNRSHEIDDAPSRPTRPPPSERVDDSIFSVNIPTENTPPSVFYMKPPPYCDKPPSYDAINDVTELPKYCTDNEAFERDFPAGSESPSTSVRVHRDYPRRSTRTVTSMPRDPPPAYEPCESRTSQTEEGSEDTEISNTEVF